MPGIEDKFGSFSATTDRDQILIRVLRELYSISGGVAPPGGLATEATLISVLNAIVAADQDIEILLVRDTGNADQVVQQITDYQTGVPVVSYKDVNGAVYVPVGPLEYLDPSAVLNLMLSEMLDQGLTLDSMETLLTTIDTVLDAIKLDTANLDVALSTRASEATLVSTNALLTTIDVVLDTIKSDTGAMVVDLAAIEVLITTTNSLLTTIDTTLDAIKLDTANLDVALSTRASELTLSGIKTQTDLLNFIATALEVNVTSSVLPTGAATQVTLAALLAELQLKADLTETQPVSLATTVRTPTYDIVTTLGAGSVTAGARSVSIKNNGAVPVTVLGSLLPVGESIGFDGGGQGDTLGAISYNIPATGSLQILKTV